MKNCARNYKNSSKVLINLKQKNPNEGSDNAYQIVKLRESALSARCVAGIENYFSGPVKMKLIVYAPNIMDMDYKQTGDDDPKKFVGDLDSLVAGVCEYLQPAPTNPDIAIHKIFNEKNGIAPNIPIIVNNDSQIIEIHARKKEDKTLHYHVEIEYV